MSEVAPPRVLVDGRCLSHAGMDGVKRYTSELLAQSAALGLPFDLARPRARTRWGQQLWEHLVLPRLARRHDVLFCPANVAPLRLARRTRLVVTLHSLAFAKSPEIYGAAFRSYYRLLIPRVIERADAILSVSQAEARSIEEHFPRSAGRVHVVPLAASAAFHPPAQPAREAELLFVGNLGPGKNLAGLLAAFELLQARIPQRLTVVGTSFKAFRAAGDSSAPPGSATRERVRWLGQVDDPGQLAELYRRAQLVVVPSLYESFGLPALEAMACGTPVLASDLPALRETIADAGEFVDARDPRALAAALERLCGDEHLRATLAERGLARAAQFSWERTARATWSILSRVAATERATEAP